MSTDRLSCADLREILEYDPSSGKLFWKARTPDMFKDGGRPAKDVCAVWNGHYAGKEALTANFDGYKTGSIFNVCVRAHRVAWAIYYGEWPDGQIDHINGNRADNRIVNLRVVSCQENLRNRCLDRRNRSGIQGVRFYKKSWQADIGVNGKRIPLGMFRTKGEAVAARKAAEQRFGFHQNHGRRPKAAVT